MTQTIIHVPASEGGGAFDPTDIVITDNTSGAFLIKDDAGSPHEYMRINTTNGAALTEFNVPSGDGAGFTINLPADGSSGNPNTGFQVLTPSGSLKFGRQATGIYTGGTAFQANAGTCLFTLQGNQVMLQSSNPDIVMNLNVSTVDFKVTDAADNDIFKVEENSSATFTLDESETGIFKVTSDGSGSPVDMLKITSGPTNAQQTVRFNFTPADRFVEFDQSSFNFRCQNASLALNAGGDIAGSIHGNYQFDTYAGGTFLRYYDTSNTTTVMQVNRAGTAFFNLRTSGETFKVKKGSTNDVLSIDADSNTNVTLEQSGANYFTVKNDASANHCFRVNGSNRHTEIERIGYGGQQYIGYSGDYIQRSQPAMIDATSEVTSGSSLAVPDMNGSPGSGTFNSINKYTGIRIHSASQSASGDLFTATLNVSDAYKDLFREMFLYVTNYDSTNAFALKIQASGSSGNWRELNSSGITGASGQTIDAATTYVYRIFQHAPGNSTATRVYGIYFMGKMAH